MDPNATLRQARAAMARGDMYEAAHLYAALDEWLSRGGFAPVWKVG